MDAPAGQGASGWERVFSKIVTDPGVGFAAGNTVLALSVAGTAGIAVSGAALLSTASLKLYQGLTGKRAFNSLYVTAGANLVAATSAFYQSAMLDGQMLTGIFSAAAFSLWGAAHVFLARREANGGRHGKILTNPFLYSLGGNLASLQVNGIQPVPTLFVIASAARSLFKTPGPDAPASTLRAFFKKHVTPVRLTSAAFLSGAIIAGLGGDPAYMAAQAIWACAACNLDKRQNSALVADLKKKPYRL